MLGFIIDVFCKDTVTGLSLFNSETKKDTADYTPLYNSSVLMSNPENPCELHKAYREILFGTSEKPQRLFKNKYKRMFKRSFKHSGLTGFTDPIACHL